MRPVTGAAAGHAQANAGEAAQAFGEPATTVPPGQVLPEQILPKAIRDAT